MTCTTIRLIKELEKITKLQNQKQVLFSEALGYLQKMLKLADKRIGYLEKDVLRLERAKASSEPSPWGNL